jgi:hypothetical protein
LELKMVKQARKFEQQGRMIKHLEDQINAVDDRDLPSRVNAVTHGSGQSRRMSACQGKRDGSHFAHDDPN